MLLTTYSGIKAWRLSFRIEHMQHRSVTVEDPTIVRKINKRAYVRL